MIYTKVPMKTAQIPNLQRKMHQQYFNRLDVHQVPDRSHIFDLRNDITIRRDPFVFSITLPR